MLYELRHYTVRPGCIDAFVEVMETHAIPFQTALGMEIVGSFVSLENPDCFVWIRRYHDDHDRQQVYDRVYGSEVWQREIRPRFDSMLLRENTKVEYLLPTPRSVLR